MELSTTQAASMVGRSERTIQRWIATGKLHARQLADGRYMVDVNELDKLRGADHADIEALLMRVDALEQEVRIHRELISTLEQEVRTLRAQVQALRSSPASKPRPMSVVPHKAEGPTTHLPDGFIALSEMIKRHGVPETSVRRAVENGALPVVRGSWPGGVKQAIAAEGHAKFYDLYHERPGFERCDQCPHL